MTIVTGTTLLGRQFLSAEFDTFPTYWILAFNLPHSTALLYRVVGTLYIETSAESVLGLSYEQRVRYPGLIGNSGVEPVDSASRFVFDCLRPGLSYKFFTP